MANQKNIIFFQLRYDLLVKDASKFLLLDSYFPQDLFYLFTGP